MNRCSVPLAMFLYMIISGVLFIVFRLLYNACSVGFILYLRDIFLLIFLHLLINHVVAPIVFLIFRRRFNYNNYWFRPKRFEKTLYTVLKVKKWKGKLGVYLDDQFSISVHPIENVINMMCHAEIVHESIAVCSFLSILLSQYGVNLALTIVTSALFAVLHLSFSIVQRYNRPRLIKIKERKLKL